MSHLLSAENRSTILTELASSLQHNFDENSVRLGVSLLQDAQTEASGAFIQTLVSLAEDGQADLVADSVQEVPKIRARLLEAVEQSLSQHSNPSSASVDENRATDADGQFIRLLRLARRLVSPEIEGSTLSHLLDSSLASTTSPDRQLAFAAREVVFAIIGSITSADTTDQTIRTCIFSLLGNGHSPWQHSLAYGLWLHQLVHTSTPIALIDDKEYFDQIANGLRHGDAESRKLCLELLRLSVSVALENGQVGLISSSTDTKAVGAQYIRYCTVYETLILARYTNLVVECEQDLRQMLSSQSVLPSRWLLTLLSTALDPKTSADQSRKYIGKWLLSGGIRALSHTEVKQILCESFLPWAGEGAHFVSSTRVGNDERFHCQHGEQLTAFIRNLLDEPTLSRDERSDLVTTLLGFVQTNRQALYSYASPYILHGLYLSITNDRDVHLTTVQAKLLVDITQRGGLPEIGRMYLRQSCAAMLLHTMRSNADLEDIYNRFVKENMLVQDKPGSDMARTHPEGSARAAKIRIAIEQCQALVSNAKEKMSQELYDSIDNIWSDAEYLELPRELLLAMPAAFFHPSIVRAAVSKSATSLQQLLSRSLLRLLDMVETRSYLLPWLVNTMRKLMLSIPTAMTVLPIVGFITQLAEQQPEPKIDLRMEYTVLRLFDGFDQTGDVIARNHYGKGETYGYALFFDLVSRLSVCEGAVLVVMEHIVDKWRAQKIPAPTVNPWKTTLQLQILLLCFEQVTLDTARSTLGEDPLKILHWLLSVEPLPRYRFLLAWIINRLYIRNPGQRDTILELLSSKDHSSNPKYLAALMKMSVELCTTSVMDEVFASRLGTLFIALSSSSKIVIRHEAQWSFPLLMDIARERRWTSISGNAAFNALDEYIRSLPRFDDPPAERVQSRFLPESQHDMTTLVEGSWTELDYTRSPYARRSQFEEIYAQDQLDGLTDLPIPCIILGPPLSVVTTHDNAPEQPNQDNILGSKQMSQEEAVALQTKGSAYLRNLLQNGDAARSRSSTLIIVASLIDNAFNLGGLSRVGEIFGARALYVRDPRVIAEKDFTSVAVSSYNHLDIMPLPVKDVTSFLAEKKADGWTCLGVEQTDRSEILGLNGTKLPKKAVLIIGNEKEGIPGDVLSQCDMLVEIPQVGVTRSMNVQTVAAVALYEYNRQHKQ